MNPRELRRLLEQTLHEESFQQHDRQTHQLSFSALRKRKLQARVFQITLLAAALTLSASTLFYFITPGRSLPLPPAQLSSSAPLPQLPAPVVPAAPEEIQSLTDQQLLDFFPPGSCFFAEANGKRILVFHDEKVRARYFN
jgi:hypothetical protein